MIARMDQKNSIAFGDPAYKSGTDEPAKLFFKAVSIDTNTFRVKNAVLLYFRNGR